MWVVATHITYARWISGSLSYQQTNDLNSGTKTSKVTGQVDRRIPSPDTLPART